MQQHVVWFLDFSLQNGVTWEWGYTALTYMSLLQAPETEANAYIHLLPVSICCSPSQAKELETQENNYL